MPKLSALKIVSLILGAAGFFVAEELQRRTTRELVEETVAERDTQELIALQTRLARLEKADLENYLASESGA